MIIYNYAITEFDVQRDLLLSELSRRGYSDATILGYKEYLNCVKKYFQQKQKSIFTNEDTSEFLKNYCDDHKLSEDSIRKCRAIIRRFDSQCEGSEWIQTIGFRKNTVNIIQHCFQQKAILRILCGIQPQLICLRQVCLWW